MKLPLIPQDKANHLVYGLIVFIVVGTFTSPVVGLGAALFVGAAKEIYDRVSGKGTPDALDFVATGFGGVLGYVCALLV
jgi:hypothetical protein